MATTTNANVDTSIPEVWARTVFRDHRVAGYTGKFIGAEGSGMPIIQKSELLGKPGDLIHIQVTNPLTGGGITGDETTLEGNEENLLTSEFKCASVLYRHGVRSFRRATKKSIVDLRSEARMRLAEWGMNKMDNERFIAFVSNAPVPGTGEVQGAATTPNVYKVGGGSAVPTTLWAAADFNDIISTDVMTVKSLQEVKLKLRLQRAKPLMMKDGQPFFVSVWHPNSTFQLKQEARYETLLREAQVRSESNPIFIGAIASIDGMIVHDHENIPTIVNASPGIKVGRGLAFGQEAFVEGLDEDVSWAEDTFDYGNQLGVAYSFAFQPRRALNLSSCQTWAAAIDVV
jgi:N4-gp56 family major capsid protein